MKKIYHVIPLFVILIFLLLNTLPISYPGILKGISLLISLLIWIFYYKKVTEGLNL